MMFKEIIAVQSENHIKPTNKFCERNLDETEYYKGTAWHHHRALEIRPRLEPGSVAR